LITITINAKYPYPYPGPVFPLSYPISAGDVLQDNDGNIYQFLSNSIFPKNPAIMDISIYSYLTSSFVSCQTASITFLTSVSAVVTFGESFYNIKKNSNGLTLYPMQYMGVSSSKLVLTTFQSKLPQCSTTLNPINTLTLNLNGSSIFNYNSQNGLIFYKDMFIAGYTQSNYQCSGEFNSITGIYGGPFCVTNEVKPNSYTEYYKMAFAYDGYNFYSGQNNPSTLVQNTTGLRYASITSNILILIQIH